MSANQFLPYINNEVEATRNGTYKNNLVSLNHLVLVMFTEDKTAIPKESAWFGAEVITQYANFDTSQTPLSSPRPFAMERVIVPMRMQPIYLENWLGLRDLDERGAIIFEECEGEHMHLGDCWKPLVRKFAGGFY